ncbi:hypothetical protein PCASD_03814 [Puccinia coronata f. sp. avenae]|nr:hypothetical protein PCASD_03814 [Puccinia coronata f. sp. avenae]
MDIYLDQLTLHIHWFMRLIIESNAQLSPSRDLAVTFANYSGLKFLVSGGVLYKKQTGSTSTASSEVRQVFAGNPLLQRAMGYNYKLDDSVSYPLDLKIKIPKEDTLPVPIEFDEPVHPQMAQVAQLLLSKHDVLHPGFEQESKPLVGMIKSIWVKKTTGANIYYVCVQGFETTEVDNHYQMRSIVRTPYHAVVHTKFILGTINVQHNCRKFDCPVVCSRGAQMERQDTRLTRPEVKHCDDIYYIINAVSLSNPDLHQLVSRLAMEPTQPGEWVECVRAGFAVWSKGTDEIIDKDTEDEDHVFAPAVTPSVTSVIGPMN